MGYNKTISRLCYLSKNLYNQANYIIRQKYFNNEDIPGYSPLIKQFQVPSDNEEYNNFQKLPAQTAHWTIKTLRKGYSVYFKTLKDYNKHKDKYMGRPGLPRYKDKNGEFMLIFTNQQCRIEDNILIFPKIVNLKVKTRLNDIDLRAVRIVPAGTGYDIEIVYRKDMDEINAIHERVIGIDIGGRNTITIADSIGNKPIAIKGGALNSINHFFNKRYSSLRSISDKQNMGKHLTKRERKLFFKRKMKIRDIMHKISVFVVDYAVSNNIDTIVIGHNEGWKQNSNMGKKGNQKFHYMPFNQLIEQIRYKAKEYGIDTIVIEESYTSKCSFLDNETIEKHDNYKGKRISRGIFRSSNGTLINADVNASYNMMKKALPKLFKGGIQDIVLHPESLTVGRMITLKSYS